MMFKDMDVGDGPVRELSLPHFYNLLTDPKEEYPSAPNVPENLWYASRRAKFSLITPPRSRRSGPFVRALRSPTFRNGDMYAPTDECADTPSGGIHDEGAKPTRDCAVEAAALAK